MGQKQLIIHLRDAVTRIPATLDRWGLEITHEGRALHYRYTSTQTGADIPELMTDLRAAGLAVEDVETEQRSLEEIFVNLTGGAA